MAQVEKQLKEQIRAIGLTVRETADSINIKPTTLASYLNGYVIMPTSIRQKLTRLLEKRLAYLQSQFQELSNG